MFPIAAEAPRVDDREVVGLGAAEPHVEEGQTWPRATRPHLTVGRRPHNQRSQPTSATTPSTADHAPSRAPFDGALGAQVRAPCCAPWTAGGEQPAPTCAPSAARRWSASSRRRRSGRRIDRSDSMRTPGLSPVVGCVTEPAHARAARRSVRSRSESWSRSRERSEVTNRHGLSTN